MPVDDVDALPLHPGFAASWQGLRPLLDARVALIVDAANVVGSKPDGWWRDRVGATERLAADLGRLAAGGVPGAVLTDAPLVATRWPGIVLVVEGEAKAAQELPAPDLLTVVRAPADGDSAVVAEARARVGSARVVVVTADRELASRSAAVGATVIGPSALRDLLA
ncbi:hypothetical protein [Frondihabitans sp. PhB188]|uniref:hypothetical protein n=1 Tax=Frondihabitans sp. PhB188 TaxID=2485200 RepID=UPI00268B1A10